jgi:hypothetical protein
MTHDGALLPHYMIRFEESRKPSFSPEDGTAWKILAAGSARAGGKMAGLY